MKLRLKGDTLRLRLSRGEVATLAARGRVDEATRLGPAPGDTLRYLLERSPDATAVGARLEAGTIVVTLPEAVARQWIETDDVGISSVQSFATEGDGTGELRILVEKDFACLTPRAEDADAFPHPGAGRGAC
ncbi:MAG TPA: hypothetical protein VFS08_03155 [Gemmatimonadaceae bacterium]|nr:hypothetical protein [Gemmatimonadaceae bacterium]